jgi:hypothetical protein
VGHPSKLPAPSPLRDAIAAGAILLWTLYPLCTRYYPEGPYAGFLDGLWLMIPFGLLLFWCDKHRH